MLNKKELSPVLCSGGGGLKIPELQKTEIPPTLPLED